MFAEKTKVAEPLRSSRLCGLLSAANSGFIVGILISLPRNALRLPDHPFSSFGPAGSGYP
jgi:hypothetical protein